MNFMKETIHIPIDKMSPQTRSQTALIKNFQQNAKRLFNFIPKDDTSTTASTNTGIVKLIIKFLLEFNNYILCGLDKT